MNESTFSYLYLSAQSLTRNRSCNLIESDGKHPFPSLESEKYYTFKR